jgi:hypothetical protein
MRHVDEGAIHAWLDGAITDRAETAWIEEHLRWCAACGARLAEERAAFEQAQALLAAGAPATEAPSFDEIAARAVQHERSQTVPGTFGRIVRERRLLHLGWAASMVLAAGIGWMAREMTEGAARPREEGLVAEAPAAAPGSMPEERRESVPEQPPFPGVNAPESARSQPSQPRDASQQSEMVRRERTTEAAVAARPDEIEGRLAAAAAPPPPAARVQAVSPPVDVRAGAAVGTATGAPMGGTAREALAEPPAARPSSAVLTESVTVTSAPVAAQADATAWRMLPRTEAAASSGMALYGLDGVDPLLTTISADNRIVRTVYRLASGATVELEQVRAVPPAVANSLAATARAPLPRGRATSIAADTATPPAVWSEIRGDVRLSLRTASSAEDVNALSMRLRVD